MTVVQLRRQDDFCPWGNQSPKRPSVLLNSRLNLTDQPYLAAWDCQPVSPSLKGDSVQQPFGHNVLEGMREARFQPGW